MERHEGTVEFYNDTGRYGFIETDASDEDVFVHSEDYPGSAISEGDQLEFRIVQAENRPRAKDVTKANSTATTQSTATTDNTVASSNTSDNNSSSPTEYEGTVDFFNDTGRYGFITSPELDDDVYFHMDTVGGPHIPEGTEVTFEVEQDYKGLRAVNVRRGHSASAPGATSTNESATADHSRTSDTEVYDAGDTKTGTNVYSADGETGSSRPSGSTSGDNASEIRFCPYCGTDLSTHPDGTFCPGCGEEL